MKEKMTSKQEQYETFSAAEVKMPDGSIQTMVSGSGKKGKVPLRIREDGDVIVQNKIPGANKKSGSSLNDAEQTIMREVSGKRPVNISLSFFTAVPLTYHIKIN